MINKCTEHAELSCKSYPKCQGCSAFKDSCFVDPSILTHLDRLELDITYDEFWSQFVKNGIKPSYKLEFDPIMPKIKDVIFNGPATIVFWEDGVKTVVKCQDGDNFDPEKGLAMAISKRVLGNKRDYYHTFKHFNRKWEKQDKANAEQLKMEFKQALYDKIENLKRGAGKE